MTILSPIPQLDGNDSLLDKSPPKSCPTPTVPAPLASVNHQVVSPGIASHLPTQTTSSPTHPSVRTRKADYALDRNKQIRNLKKDAVISDFEIIVSKNQQNVNVDCNVGFYATVAVPALHNLTTGQVRVYDGIAVQCKDIVGNFDTTQAQQTTILFFHLSLNKASVGTVRIHLHHTTRKVQVQGGAILPDKRYAPVWFVDTVLAPLFIKASNEKAEDITKFNQAVANMPSSKADNATPHTCGGCNAQFNRRSSPELCRQCHRYFHKKCFPSHACLDRLRNKRSGQDLITSVPNNDYPARNNPALIPPPTRPSGITCLPVTVTTVSQVGGARDDHQLVTTTGLTSSQSSHSVQDISPLPTFTALISPSLMNDDPAVVAGPSATPDVVISLPHEDEDHPACAASTPSTCQVQTWSRADHHPSAGTHTSLLNPEAIPYVNNDRPTYQAKVKPKNKPKNNLATKAHDVDAELANAEISTLQAKLQLQETEIKDLKFRNTILMERNKSLEEAKKKEIYNRYFPSRPEPEHAPHQPAGSEKQCHHGVQSCFALPAMYHPCMPPPCMHSCQSQSHASVDTTTRDSILAANDKLVALCQAVTNVQSLLDKIASVPSANTSEQQGTVPSEPTCVPTSCAQTPPCDSLVSIDEFMFEETGAAMDTDNLN